MLSIVRFFVHSTLLLLAWDHPADIDTACVLGDDGQRAVMPQRIQFVFAAYTCWIGFELGTSVLSKTLRFDMIVHHVFTIVAVLNAWQFGMICIGYSVVRATLLCEPLVDLYFIFKNVRHVHHITDVCFVGGFLYTRLVFLAKSCIIPLLWHFNTVISHRSEFIGVACVTLLYVMQWMWATKIFSKLFDKLYQ